MRTHPLRIRSAGPADAAVVHALTQEAFAGYATLDPPSGAVAETEDVVREQLAKRGGALAYLGDVPVGCYRLEDHDDGTLHVRRVSVGPAYRGRGICSALMAYAEETARAEGRGELRVGVRVQLPENRALYEHLGYTMVADHGIWVELRKEL